MRKPLIDGSTQKVMPTFPCARILNIAYYSLLAGRPGEHRMYDSLRQEIHCPQVVCVVYTVFINCTECPRIGTNYTHQRKLELFPPPGPHEFVAINIFGPLPRTKDHNQFNVIMTSRRTRLATAISTTMLTSAKVVHIFFSDWTVPCGIPSTVLSENSQQFVKTFFTSIRSYLGATKLTTTAFQP